MKLLLLLFFFFFSTVQAHDPLDAGCVTLGKNAYIPQDLIRSVQQNAYWALLRDKLILCYGIHPNTKKPICMPVPKQYIVIELPKNLQ